MVECAECGTPFAQKHKRMKFCSKRCLWRAKNRRHEARQRQWARASYKANPERYRARAKAYRERDPAKWRAVAQGYYQSARLRTPWKALLAEAKRRATAKNLPFDLTTEWAKETWTGFCAVSKLPFLLGQRGPGPKSRSPSIDRIVASRGYVQDNCRFVIHAVNALKGEGTDESMFEVVRAIFRTLDSQFP